MQTPSIAVSARRHNFIAVKNRAGVFLPTLIAMSDAVRAPDAFGLLRCLPTGAGLILRHTNQKTNLAAARRLARACRQRGVVFFLAGDQRDALRAGAEGWHMSERIARQQSATPRRSRRRGRIKFVTAAAHSPLALQRAYRAGADAALLSPVFFTDSHPEALPIGALRFAAWAARSPLPVYALGGVGANQLRRLKNSTAVGVAGISGFVN